MIIGTPAARAPRATARSESACAISATPIGEVNNGDAKSLPSNEIDWSRRLTSRIMRGTIRRASSAARLLSMVVPDPAPVCT